MSNKPKKPLALEVADASKELVAAIEQIAAKHGLPCYIMEPLVANVLSRLENGRRVETENARRSYEQQLAEWSEKNDE